MEERDVCFYGLGGWGPVGCQFGGEGKGGAKQISGLRMKGSENEDLRKREFRPVLSVQKRCKTRYQKERKTHLLQFLPNTFQFRPRDCNLCVESFDSRVQFRLVMLLLATVRYVH